MKFLSEFKYGTITEGKNQGVLAIHLSFNPSRIPEDDDEIISILYKIMNYKTGTCKNISISGEYPKDPSCLVTLTQSLKSHNYRIQAIINGKSFYPWLNYVDWVIAELEEPKWAAFVVQEIRLHFKENLIEPTESPKFSPARYIIMKAGFTNKQVFSWIRSAEREWNILLKNKGVFE